MVTGVLRVAGGHWGRERDIFMYRVLALLVNDVLYRMPCFVKKVLARLHALYVHLTYKDDSRFRKGSVHELFRWKTYQVSKLVLKRQRSLTT